MSVVVNVHGSAFILYKTDYPEWLFLHSSVNYQGCAPACLYMYGYVCARMCICIKNTCTCRHTAALHPSIFYTYSNLIIVQCCD